MTVEDGSRSREMSSREDSPNGVESVVVVFVVVLVVLCKMCAVGVFPRKNGKEEEGSVSRYEYSDKDGISVPDNDRTLIPEFLSVATTTKQL